MVLGSQKMERCKKSENSGVVMNFIKIENVVKLYKEVVALNGITFNIPKGSIFGLLGPNGAGKTTLIRIINRILGIDGGQIYFDNELLSDKHTEKIGYLPEERGLYPDMKVFETLLYLAKLKGVNSKQAKGKVIFWMKKFNISDWKEKKIKELSKGMQQKVQFIASVIHDPELLILDEPFTGFDPVNTQFIKNIIKELNQQGKTIIFSTHRMEQVEDICKEIVLINKGRVILSGEISHIKKRFKKNIYLLEYEGDIPDKILEEFNIIKKNNHHILVKLIDNNAINRFLEQVLKYAFIISFMEKLPSLDEIFIEQVGGLANE